MDTSSVAHEEFWRRKRKRTYLGGWSVAHDLAFLGSRSREELKVLARHYLDEAQDIRFFMAVCGTSGGDEIRQIYFNNQRLEEIEHLLGERGLREALSEIRSKWERTWAELEEDMRGCPACQEERRRFPDRFPAHEFHMSNQTGPRT